MATYVLSASSIITITATSEEAGDLPRRLVSYAPVITGPTTVPATISQTVVSELTFSYGGLSLVMPKPDFGDTDTLEVTVQSTQLSSGTIVINPQTDTSIRSKSYTFTGICEEKKKEYLTFISSTVGQTITMSDFEGNTQNILITSIDSEIKETITGYEIELEYEEV